MKISSLHIYSNVTYNFKISVFILKIEYSNFKVEFNNEIYPLIFNFQ